MQFIRDNYFWVVPILVALVSGIIAGVFYLIKKSGHQNKQSIKGVNNSTINQANGDITTKNK